MTDQAIIELIEQRRANHLLDMDIHKQRGDAEKASESCTRASEAERILAIINRVDIVSLVAMVHRINQQREAANVGSN